MWQQSNMYKSMLLFFQHYRSSLWWDRIFCLICTCLAMIFISLFKERSMGFCIEQMLSSSISQLPIYLIHVLIHFLVFSRFTIHNQPNKCYTLLTSILCLTFQMNKFYISVGKIDKQNHNDCALVVTQKWKVVKIGVWFYSDTLLPLLKLFALEFYSSSE
jgi:hypothetical protein